MTTDTPPQDAAADRGGREPAEARPGQPGPPGRIAVSAPRPTTHREYDYFTELRRRVALRRSDGG